MPIWFRPATALDEAMVRIIKSEDLAGLIPLDAAIKAVGRAYTAHASAPAFGSTHTRLFDGNKRATFHPGGSVADNAVGMFAHFEHLHRANNAQSYTGLGRRVYAMYDSETAELTAILLGSLPLFPFDPPTAHASETAITSAVGTALLARPDAKVLALIGTGRQARRHLFVANQQFNLEEVRVFSRDPHNVASFCNDMSAWTTAPLRQMADVGAAVDDADIVICATASLRPVLDGERLAPGCHVTSIVNGNRLIGPDGAPVFRRELDNKTVQRADVICAVLREQAIKDEQGDLFEPVSKGIINWDDIRDLSDVLAGHCPGRTTPEQITLFKQNSDQGIGFMALARLAYEIAKHEKIGIEF